MTTLGIIGAGKVGSQVARRAVAQGYDVVLSNSRGPESLAELVSELGPHASAGTPVDAAAADLVLVAVPTRAIDDLPLAALAGKVVIDSDNYYNDRDGHIVELEEHTTTSSERLAKLLPDSFVVKTLNHIYAAEITTTATPVGTPDRRALAIFGDSTDAKTFVSNFLNDCGFDAVDAGPLSEGWRLQPGTIGYCVPATAAELRATLAATVAPTQASTEK